MLNTDSSELVQTASPATFHDLPSANLAISFMAHDSPGKTDVGASSISTLTAFSWLEDVFFVSAYSLNQFHVGTIKASGSL